MRTAISPFSTLGGIAAIVLWSSTIALARGLTEQLGPLTAGACVYLTGTLFFLIRFPGRHSTTASRPPSRLYVWGCGSLFVLYTVLLYLAVGFATDRTQVLEIGIVNYLWPALTIWFAIPLLQQRATVLLIPGTLLALTGVVLVMHHGSGFDWRELADRLHRHPLPYLLAAAAAVCWALYSNLTRRWSAKGTGGAVGYFVASTGLLLTFLRFTASESSTWTVTTLGSAVLLGGITALAYALWDRAMRSGNLVLVAGCSYLTPLLSTLVSCLYLDVRTSPKLWWGCLLLVLGSVLSWQSLSSNSSPGPADEAGTPVSVTDKHAGD